MWEPLSAIGSLASSLIAMVAILITLYQLRRERIQKLKLRIRRRRTKFLDDGTYLYVEISNSGTLDIPIEHLCQLFYCENEENASREHSFFYRFKRFLPNFLLKHTQVTRGIIRGVATTLYGQTIPRDYYVLQGDEDLITSGGQCICCFRIESLIRRHEDFDTAGSIHIGAVSKSGRIFASGKIRLKWLRKMAQRARWK